VRTISIAAIAGAVAARFSGGWGRWPMISLLMLWPSFGGHWVEILFLNWLRPRIPAGRGVQIAARVLVWFIGGTGLAIFMVLTAMALPGFRTRHWHAWWIGGLGFIGIELVAHLVLQFRGRPNLYNGRE
jgi:hypothetical protein